MNFAKYSNILVRCIRSTRSNAILNNSVKIPSRLDLRYATIATETAVNRAERIKPTIYSILDRNVDGQNRVKLYSVLKGIEAVDNLGSITDDQAVLLLQCCGKISPDHTVAKRQHILETVWTLLEKNQFVFTAAHYNTYIKMCTENGVVLNHKSFLVNVKCEPNQEMYKALVENVCEKGDTSQALAILNVMKEKQVAVDQDFFNCLILAHTIEGGLEGAENVFKMMKTANIPQSDYSKHALLRGLIIRSDEKQFNSALDKIQLIPSGQQFLKMLHDMGLNGNHNWLPKIVKQINVDQFSRKYAVDIENMCIHLIHAGKSEAAFYFYKQLVRPVPETHYAKVLINEIVRADTSPDLMLKILKDLNDTELNKFALENATESALSMKKIDVGWILLENFSYLRQHFFWPMFLFEGNQHGEDGIFKVLEKVVALNVKVDYETLQFYCLPFCDVSDVKSLVEKFQKCNLTIREIFTPILATLLRQNELLEAKKLCETYECKLEGERLLKLFVAAWRAMNNPTDIIPLIKKLCESTNRQDDWTGLFLQNAIKTCKTAVELQKFHATIKLFGEEKLTITSESFENLVNLVKRSHSDDPQSKEVLDALDSIHDFTITQTQPAIPHPRDMSLEQLECHLVELEHKGMETRGVLRRLIQKLCSAGNHQRVQELRRKLIKSGYGESAGMKASIFHSYVLSGHLEAALDLYHELKSLHSSFSIDSFKVLDLAALMVKENQFADAVKLLKSESEKRVVQGGPMIERNCWELLDAAKEPQHTEELFELLSSYGYCKPSNVILGPRVRIHLKSGDLQSATKAYVRYANEFHCTPLQLELLCKLLEAKEEKLFQDALAVTEKVHGKTGAISSVIFAFAEQGMEKPLRAFLMQKRSLPMKEMFKKRYNRWVSEGKLGALETLYRAVRKLALDFVDVPYLQLCIMKCYCLKTDCDGALAFWQELIDNEIYISSEMNEMLHKLLTRCKYKVPSHLQI